MNLDGQGRFPIRAKVVDSPSIRCIPENRVDRRAMRLSGIFISQREVKIPDEPASRPFRGCMYGIFPACISAYGAQPQFSLLGGPRPGTSPLELILQDRVENQGLRLRSRVKPLASPEGVNSAQSHITGLPSAPTIFAHSFFKVSITPVFYDVKTPDRDLVSSQQNQ